MVHLGDIAQASGAIQDISENHKERSDTFINDKTLF